MARHRRARRTGRKKTGLHRFNNNSHAISRHTHPKTRRILSKRGNRRITESQIPHAYGMNQLFATTNSIDPQVNATFQPTFDVSQFYPQYTETSVGFGIGNDVGGNGQITEAQIQQAFAMAQQLAATNSVNPQVNAIFQSTFPPDLRNVNLFHPQKPVLTKKPTQLICQFCKESVITKVTPIKMKEALSKKRYKRHMIEMSLFLFLPFLWPILICMFCGKSFDGSKHICPRCYSCIGIYFNRKMQGMATSRDQQISTIIYSN